MKKQAILLISAFLLGVFALTGITSDSAYAEDAKPAVWLQISPTQERVSLDPGDTHDGKIKVSNIGSEDFTFKIYASPFSVVGEDYNHNYESMTDYNQISRWITFPQSEFSLPVGESIEVSYHVAVPEDVPGGSQHAVIFAESSESTTSEGIKAVSRVGMRLIASISGETREGIEITDYSLPQLYISFSAPKLTATSRVKNTGNTDFEARYRFEVKTFFGSEVVYTNNETQLIYPDSELKRTATWEDTPLLGLFNVTYSVSANKYVEESTRLILVMPAWLLIIILVLLTFIIVWIILTVKKRRQLRSKVQF